ncbi:MAG: hypothetical protein VB085_04060 [Peptococcaceae bacterium]|nr:hypothetical protein [Peptococcaceae bacterium]
MKPFGKKSGTGRFLLKATLLCLSFALVFLATYSLNQAYLKETAATARVVTARRRLLPGEKLVQEDLVMAERALFGLGADYSEDPAALLSQSELYVDELGFDAGDIIRPKRLKKEKQAVGGAERIEKYLKNGDKRLLALKTDLIASGGDWLKPGIRADAFVYLEGKNSFGEVVEAKVLGPTEDPFLGDLLIGDRKTAAGSDPDEAEEALGRDRLPAAVVVVLEAAEEERMKSLIRYNEEGRIYFSPTGNMD